MLVYTDKIQLDCATLSLYEPDLLIIDIDSRKLIGGAEAKMIFEAHAKLAKGKELLVLLKADELTQFDREAREFSASEQAQQCSKAEAMVVKNLAQRLIANFYIQFDKPVKMSKVFNNENDALKWLERFR